MVRLMVVLGLVLSLAACGGGSDGLSRSDEKALEERVLAAEAARAQAEADKAAAEAAQARAEADKVAADAAKARAEAEAQHQLRAAEAARERAEAAERIAQEARAAAEAAAAAAAAARGEADTAKAERDRLETEAQEAEQRVTQRDAEDALAGLGTNTAAPSVTPNYNAPATVDGFRATGSSAGSGWYATRATASNQELLAYSDVKAPTRTRDFITAYSAATAVGDSTTLVQITPANNTDLAASSQFPTAGATKPIPLTVDTSDPRDGTPDQAKISGSYHGASGNFVCSTDPCSITHVGGKLYSFSSGWQFQTSRTTKVTDDDSRYMHFGWWRQRTSGGFNYGVFSGKTPSADLSGSFTSTTGKADYVGPAIGHYAIHQTLGAQSNHGEFKATARLTANFVTNKLSGSISEFDVNPDWEVTLEAGADMTPAGGGGNVSWAINGIPNTPDTPPTWSATFHSETPNYAGHDPEGVTGIFHAQYGSVAAMRGAFGAHRQ